MQKHVFSKGFYRSSSLRAVACMELVVAWRKATDIWT